MEQVLGTLTLRELEASMAFDTLMGSQDGHMALLPEVKGTTPFGRGEQAAQIPEDDWLFSSSLKSSYSAG